MTMLSTIAMGTSNQPNGLVGDLGVRLNNQLCYIFNKSLHAGEQLSSFILTELRSFHSLIITGGGGWHYSLL